MNYPEKKPISFSPPGGALSVSTNMSVSLVSRQCSQRATRVYSGGRGGAVYSVLGRDNDAPLLPGAQVPDVTAAVLLGQDGLRPDKASTLISGKRGYYNEGKSENFKTPNFWPEKSRIRETPTLLTDADSRADTNLKRLHDLSSFFFN